MSSSSILHEPPNIISLLSKRLSNETWAWFLHDWENIIFSVGIALCIIVIFHLSIRKRKLIPGGMQNFFEMVVEQLTQLIHGVLGPEGKKFIPFLGTLFIYILCMNLFGLLPLMKSPSVSLNITIAMAICVFCLVQFMNIRHMGFFGFLYHMAGSPKNKLEWMLTPIMFPIEILTQISRPITLSLRLFGNIMGEEVLIGYFTLLGVTAFALLKLPIHGGFPLQIPFMLLGILTSLMQALVFTLLTAVYIMFSLAHDEKKEEK